MWVKLFLQNPQSTLRDNPPLGFGTAEGSLLHGGYLNPSPFLESSPYNISDLDPNNPNSPGIDISAGITIDFGSSDHVNMIRAFKIDPTVVTATTTFNIDMLLTASNGSEFSTTVAINPADDTGYGMIPYGGYFGAERLTISASPGLVKFDLIGMYVCMYIYFPVHI